MPKLPNYTAEIPGGVDAGGGRRATAQDFGAPGLGDAGLVGAGHMVQAAAQRQLNEMEETEARKALIESTQIRAEYARKLDEAALSGADLGKIKEDMVTALTKVGEGFSTKKGAEQLSLYTANSEIMYDQQANQIAVQRAWSQARLDGQKFVNGASALIQSNPAYLQVAEKDAADFVASFPGIRSDQRAELTDRLKKDLNMASAVSAARIDPEAARKRLEAGEWDLTPEQRQTAIDKAGAEIRAKRADEAYQRAEQERIKHDNNDKARDEGFASIMNGTFSRRQIMDDPRLLPATREHLVMLAEARAKAAAGEERKSDPATKRDLWLAINAPEGDPRKIYTADAIFKAVESGKLNPTDANQLNGLVALQKDENGRSFQGRLQGRIVVLGRALNESPEFKAQPDLSAAIQMSLVDQVEKKASELRKAGKSPDSLLDPDSEDYFFKPGILQETARAIRQQALNARIGDAVRVGSLDELLRVPDGKMFVDDSGTPKTMTPDLRKKLAKNKPAVEFPVVPSGETPDKIAQREAARVGAKYSDWQQGIGK